MIFFFFFSSRRRHTRYWRDWSSDVCSSDLLYVKKAFGSTALTFLVTVAFLSASFAATGSLATGFASYFATLWEGPPALLVSLVFILALVVVNFIGITESAAMNMLMTFVELAGLDRKSTRLNSSHANISYAVFCLKKKT